MCSSHTYVEVYPHYICMSTRNPMQQVAITFGLNREGGLAIGQPANQVRMHGKAVIGERKALQGTQPGIAQQRRVTIGIHIKQGCIEEPMLL